jgi:hypothetical protein
MPNDDTIMYEPSKNVVYNSSHHGPCLVEYYLQLLLGKAAAEVWWLNNARRQITGLRTDIGLMLNKTCAGIMNLPFFMRDCDVDNLFLYAAQGQLSHLSESNPWCGSGEQ